MTNRTDAMLHQQLDAIRSDLAALKEDLNHMKRKLLMTEGEPPAPIWNEKDRQAAIEFWRKNDRWRELSDASRRVLRAQLFGGPEGGGDEFTGLK